MRQQKTLNPSLLASWITVNDTPFDTLLLALTITALRRHEEHGEWGTSQKRDHTMNSRKLMLAWLP